MGLLSYSYLLLMLFLINFWLGTQNPNMITTQMEVNNIMYDAVCDWGREVTNQIRTLSEVKCTPTKIRIRQDKQGRQANGEGDIDLNNINDFLGRPSDTSFVDPHYANFRCLDGRYGQNSLFTMGGDIGEFFLGLVVYEELIAVELTPSQIKRILTSYMDQMEMDNLHWCTDDQAIAHIESMLGETGIDIQNPRPDIQDSIIQIISQPYNIGDTHFKAMLNEADTLNIRKQLIEDFIRVFYRMLWDKDSEYSRGLELVQLVNSHQELAFLDIRNQKDWNAPLIHSENRDLGFSLYIYHHEAANARRAQLAYFFTNQLQHMNINYDPQVLEHRIDNHALSFLEVTGRNIARNLPFYTILYQ